MLIKIIRICKLFVDIGAKFCYNSKCSTQGHGVMVTRGSPKPLLRVRVLLPLPKSPAYKPVIFYDYAYACIKHTEFRDYGTHLPRNEEKFSGPGQVPRKRQKLLLQGIDLASKTNNRLCRQMHRTRKTSERLRPLRCFFEGLIEAILLIRLSKNLQEVSEGPQPL